MSASSTITRPLNCCLARLARPRFSAPATATRNGLGLVGASPLPSCSPSSTASSFHTSSPALSKIGKRLITLPPEVQVAVEEGPELIPFTKSKSHVVVSGPKGKLSMPLHPFLSFETTSVEGSSIRRLKVLCEDADKRKFNRAMWGTTNALLNNMVEGVTDGCSVTVRLVGVGYRATLIDGALDLKLGYSHQILLPVPKSVTVQVQNPQRLRISGIDWHEVTKFASQIRAWRPPEPYNQKGVFVGDETIAKKEGKKK